MFFPQKPVPCACLPTTHNFLNATALTICQILISTTCPLLWQSINNFLFISFDLCVYGVHILYVCEGMCVHVHMCCMWMFKTDVGNHRLSLFHFIHLSRISQSNPEKIISMTHFVNPLVLDDLVFIFLGLNYRQAIVPIRLSLGSWDQYSLFSSTILTTSTSFHYIVLKRIV